MPSLQVLSCEQVKFDGDVITATGAQWKSCANFDVGAGKNDFSLAIDITEAPYSPFCCGIMRRDATLAQLCKMGGPGPKTGYGMEVVEGGIPTTDDRGMARGDTFTLRYSNFPARKLTVSVNDGEVINIDVPKGIADAEYVPYLVVRDKNHSFQVRVVTQHVSRGKKRGRSVEQSRKHAESMWLERRFTDAEVVTRTGVIRVHRAIMCSCQPFRAAFEGGYVESTSCTMAVKGVTHATVEAFIQYIYIGRLPDEVDYPELLQLAHQFEVNDIVEVCAETVVDKVDASNVCEAARVLRTYKEHPSVNRSWQELLQKAEKNTAIREMLLMEV